MLVIIDESGDPSFTKRSSEYFLIAMVVINSFEEAEKISAAIEKARIDSGFRREFKFSACKDQMKECFFKAISKFDFTVRVFVSRKDLIREPYLRHNPKKFYNFCLKQMLSHDGGTLNNATIKIDGSGGRDFRNACISYIRKQMPQGKIKDLKFKDSKRDNLIQLADMIVGAVARPYNSPDKPEPTKWKNMVKNKISSEWGFR